MQTKKLIVIFTKRAGFLVMRLRHQLILVVFVLSSPNDTFLCSPLAIPIPTHPSAVTASLKRMCASPRISSLLHSRVYSPDLNSLDALGGADGVDVGKPEGRSGEVAFDRGQGSLMS